MVEVKYFAGIGSRETPKNILHQMVDVSRHLSKIGYTLRSGHADGADLAFETGATKAEIWLPWASFNKNLARSDKHIFNSIREDDKEAFDSVKQFHPNSIGFSRGVLALMARNFRQVIGLNSPNSEFIVCWTKDGGNTGGTGQALRIAQHYNIPIYNLFFTGVFDSLMKMEA